MSPKFKDNPVKYYKDYGKKSGWRIGIKFRQIRKGKNKGKYQVVTSLGKKYVVRQIIEL